MAALTVKAASEEMAAALAALATPLLDAEAVMLGISKTKFRAPGVERELAVAISNSAAVLRKAAREQAAIAESILRGAREFHQRALALAAMEGEKEVVE